MQGYRSARRPCGVHPPPHPLVGGRAGGPHIGTQPLAVCSCARIIHDGENRSCSKPPSVEAEAVFTPDACVWPLTGTWASPMYHSLGPPLESTIAATLENSVCSTHPLGWMPVHGMAKHRPDVAVRCCAGLGAQSGELGAHRTSAQCGIPFSGPCHLLGLGVDAYPPSVRGLLGVKDIAAPEVKFLDRCKINCSEGVLHLPVRRSRMRVWGAKMIRHRRSPPL